MSSTFKHILQQAEILEQSIKFIEKSYIVYTTEEEKEMDLNNIIKLLENSLEAVKELKLK